MRHRSLCIIGVALCLGQLASVVAADDLFDARGFNRNRQSFSQLPFEHIDPLTGNLLLTFTDLVLPGNAGFDLRIQRTYNSKIHLNYLGGSTTLREDSWAGIGWTLHLGRVFNGGGTDLSNPIIEMPDGSLHPTYVVPPPQSPSWCSPCFITRDYWLYDKGDSQLLLTNGAKYTFGHLGSGFTGSTGARYATLIEDPFGNRIEATYRIATPTDALAQVIQRVGAQSRTIDFTVSNGALSTMTYSGRTWQYQEVDSLNGVTFSPFTVLTAVTPPIGPSWQFEYAGTGSVKYEMLKVTTPNGGTVTYTYRDNAFAVGTTYGVTARVVGTRVVGGRDIAAGSWTYTYPTGVGNQTTVSGPCVSTTYTFEGVGTNTSIVGSWKVGLPRTIQNQEETVTLTWQAGAAISSEQQIIGFNVDNSIFVPLQSGRSVARGASTYTTTNSYASTNFNDYGRPNTINETGELSRSTSRTFNYAFTPYIKDKVASETATVSSQSFARSWSYNSSGFTTAETVYGVQTTFSPDSNGNVASATNARSYQTFYDYSWGVRSRVQTPQHVTTRVINSDGTVSSESRRGFTWGFGYDSGGRLTSENPPAGASTTISYSGGTSITRSRSTSSVTEFLDGFGRTSATQDAVGINTDTNYDACGRTVYQSLPYTTSNAGTTYVPDALGRVTRATYPGGAFETFSYSGNDVTRTDEGSRQTLLRYRSFGDPAERRLTSVTDAANVVTSYTWNTVGSLTGVSGSATGTRSWGYNTRNQLTSETHPESGSTTYARDSVGNMTSRTDAQNPATTYTYDGNDRLVAVDAPGTDYDATITYDDADNRTGVANSYAALTFVWDGANRLTRRTQVSGAVSFVTDFGLDADGNVTAIDYPSGAHVTYTVDAMGRTTSATRDGTTVASLITYHPSGNIASFRSGDGTTHSMGFDNRHRPTSAVTTAGLNVVYTRNSVGNVTAIDDPRPGFNSLSFGYDPLDRITSIGGFGANTFTYDNAGNRLTKTSPSAAYTIGASTSRLMSISGAASEVASFTYDNNGNQTGHGASTFTYSPTNMLSTATVAGATSTYRYDGDDRRVLRITGGRTFRSLHGRGGELLGEFDVTGGVTRWVRDYIYAGGRLITAASCNVTPSSSTLSFTQAGGGQVLSVSAPANCAWQPSITTTPTPSWLSLSGTAESLGAGSVTVTATLNNTGTARTATIQIVAGKLVQVTQQPSACTYGVTGTTFPISPAGGTGSIGVTALVGCAWTAAVTPPTPPSWVTITSGASGNGNGSVAFSAAANPTTAPRTATIAVAGFNASVIQVGAACMPTVAPTALSFTGNAGAANTTVTAATGCAWTATSPVGWATLQVGGNAPGASISGSGTSAVTVAVQDNLSVTPRSTTLTVAGVAVTVSQAAYSCSYSLSPSNPSIPLAGGSATVTVTTGSICGWTVDTTSFPVWATAAPISGSGTGSVTFTAGAGPSAGRSKAVTIAGQSILLTQLGVPCTYTGTPAVSPWFPPAGATSSVDIAVPVTCPAGVNPVSSSGLPVTPTPIAGGVRGTYTVPANTSPLPRTGTITMAGQVVHTVNQLGISQPMQAIETPLANTVLQGGGVTVAGYAADLASQVDTGVTFVHVYVDGGYAGQATYGLYHAGAAAQIAAGQLAPRFLNVGYSLPLTLGAGRHTITAYAYSTVSASWNSATVFPVDVNTAPSVAVTAPASGTVLQAGQPVTFTAAASDPDAGDSVIRVEYYASGLYVGQATTAPYAVTNPSATAGSYAVIARAFDARGGTRDSAAIALAVNAPPAVTMTAPASGTLVALGQTLTFSAAVSDPEGDAVTVTYEANGGAFSPAVGAPYSYTVAASAFGTFAITARAVDARGGVAVSAPITLVINAPPAVTLTSPGNGVTLAVGQGFTIVASATDPDDGVQRVEFTYNGGTPLATLTAAPYQVPFPGGVGAGTYTIAARVFDTRGAWADAAPMTFYVTGGLEVRLGGPAGPPGLDETEAPSRPGPRAHGTPARPVEHGTPTRPLEHDTSAGAWWLALRQARGDGARLGRRGRPRVVHALARLPRAFGCAWAALAARRTRQALLALLLLLGMSTSAAAQVTLEYYHLDPMGSVRMVTDSTGTVTQRYDYQPFGEDTSVGGQPRKYAAKERDPETGYDYFGGRYYANRLGRFTTADPAYRVEENLIDPQRWNRYTYVRNNPYKYADPDGRILETLWDLANVGIGAASLVGNVSIGNWAGAALDLAGLIADGASVLAPGVPGGAGTAIKAARAGVAANRAAGKAAEARVAAELVAEGKQILGSQVCCNTNTGRRVIDFLTKSPAGDIAAVEVKSGTATRSASQLAKDTEIAAGRGTFVGRNSPPDIRGRQFPVNTVERKPQ